MKTVFALVMYYDHEIEVDIFATQEAAENAFMRDLYESFQDFDLPGTYDPAAISDVICGAGESLVWKIEECAVPT